jgi:filamentous hemagglutinin family protein
MSSITSTTPFKRKLVAAAVISCFSTGNVLAASSADATVAHGSATFSVNGSTLTITNTPNAIINWAKFGIDAGETVKFVQQSSASAVLNRVTGSDPSHILGALQSNGKVYLINPNGIMFGANSRIDVNGLIASTLNLTDADFLAGKLNFNADRATPGSVVNAGQITTPSGGFVYLLAPNVENSGVITTPSGEAILAAGNSIEIVDSTDPSQRVLVSATSKDVNLSNLMTQSNGNIFTVLNSGKVSANTVVQDQTGKIYFKSVNKTLVTGTAEARGDVGKGGQVQVLGNVVGVYEHAVVDASGRDGGGTVLIGGDYQGKNTNVQNATVTYFGPDAQIHADAIENGNGGKVILWADDTTRAYGHITAKGGSIGGNGGFVETSGHRYLDVTQAADASAAHGLAGTWLLDPTDISIVHGSSDSNISSYGGAFTPVSSVSTSSVISDTTLNAAINGGTSVSISTSSAAGGNGDITFDGLVSGAVVIDKSVGATFGTTLTLNADRDIRFKGSTTIQNSSTTQSFAVVMNTGAGRSIKSDASDSANVTVNSSGGQMFLQVNGGKTWENSGTVSLLGKAQINLNDGSSAATFNNSGTVNITNNTSGWAFYSNSNGLDNGVINNSGVLTVTGSTAFEAELNNSSTGVISVSGGGLNLQNANVLSGIFNIDSGASLNLTETHAGIKKFDSATVINNGALAFNVAGTFNNSSLSSSGNLVVPTANVAYTGTNTFIAGGDLTLSGTFSGSGVNFYAGNNVNISAATLSVSDYLNVYTAGTVTINGSALSGGGGSGFGVTASTVNITNSSITASGGPGIDIVANSVTLNNDNLTHSYTGGSYPSNFPGIEVFGTTSLLIDHTNISATSSVSGVLSGVRLISQNLTLQNVSTISADMVGLNYDKDFIVTNTADFLNWNSTANVVVDNSYVSANTGLGFAGNNVTIKNGGSLSSAQDMHGIAMNDLKLDGGHLSAYSEMLLEMGGHLYLDNSSSIYVGLPLTLRLNFPYLASDGWLVDGVANSFGTTAGSWIQVDGAAPIEGVNFFVTYGGLQSIVPILNLMDKGLIDPGANGLIDAQLVADMPTGDEVIGNDEEKKEEDKPQQCSA